MVSLQAAIPIYNLTLTPPVMNKSKVSYTKGTIMNYVNNQPKYSIMRYLLQLSGLDEYMNIRQAKYITFLLPDDEALLKRFTKNTLKHIDRQNARDLIFFHILMGRFTKKMLHSFVNVKIPSQLGSANFVHLVQLNSKPVFNGIAHIKEDEEVALFNGLIMPITIALDPYIA